MQDLRNLYNQALTVVGSAPNVVDPLAPGKPTEILSLWYPLARRAVFTAAHWPSLRKHARLAKVAERDTSLDWTEADPSPDFLYAFAYPSDMLRPQYMEDFSRFSLGTIGEQKVINSDNPTPILTYTKDLDNPVFWESDLYMCVVWTLGACINMAKSGKMALTQKLEEQVNDMILQSATNSANSDDTYFEATPSFWAGSGFSIPNHQTRFYYPTTSFRISGLVA